MPKERESVKPTKKCNSFIPFNHGLGYVRQANIGLG